MIENSIDIESRSNYWKSIYFEKNRDDFWYHLAGADKDISQTNYNLANSSILYYFYRFSLEKEMLKYLVGRFCKEHIMALDMGGGTGRNALTLSEFFKKVISFDLVDSFVEENKRRYKAVKNISFFQLSIDNLDKLPKDNYDLIFLGGVFMCLGDDEVKSALNKIQSLLKRDGILIVRDSISSMVTSFYDRVKIYRSEETYESLFIASRFSMVGKYNSANRNLWCSLFNHLPRIVQNRKIILQVFEFFIFLTIKVDSRLIRRQPFIRHSLSNQLFYVFKKYED